MPESKFPNKQVKVNSIGLKEAFQNVMNWLYTGSVWVRQKAESTGEASNVNYGKQSAGTITAVKLENAGEQAIAAYGVEAAGTITGMKVEAAGEQAVSLYAEGTAGTLQNLRSNNDQQLVVEVIGAGASYTWVQTDPVELTTSSQTLYSPGAGASTTYLIEFNVVNIDYTNYVPVTVNIGHDIGANGGALADKELWLLEQVVGYPGCSGWQGPYTIAGDDAVTGLANVNNAATIHFRIRSVNE